MKVPMFHWPWNRIQVNQLVGLVKKLLSLLHALKLTQLLADSLVKCIRSVSLFWFGFRTSHGVIWGQSLNKNHTNAKQQRQVEPLNPWIIQYLEGKILKQATELLISLVHFTAMILPGPLLSRPWAIYEDWLAVTLKLQMERLGQIEAHKVQE